MKYPKELNAKSPSFVYLSVYSMYLLRDNKGGENSFL